MKIKKLLFVLLIGMTIILSGCSMADSAEYDPAYYGDEYSNEDTDPEEPAPVIDDADLEGGDVVQDADIPALLDRKIIYTASLGMNAPDPEIVYNNVMSELDTYGAYVESANITNTRYVVKIRVLSANFTDFIEEIKTTGDVSSYVKTSEDVTNAYSTFEARKLALETQHARILELIEVAVDLDDILTLEDARIDIESELNQIGDTLANYDSLVDYSTINLTINKTSEAVVVLPQTASPTVYVNEHTKNTAEVEVRNNDDLPVVIYLDVLQNGEFVKQYEGEAFPNGVSVFEIGGLDSNTDYTFRVTAISAEHRESNVVNRSALTESTFFNKVGNVFTSSFTVLVAIFEFLGLAIVAILPFAIVFTVIFIPSRILYLKKGKQLVEARKQKKRKAIDERIKEGIKREEEMNNIRMQKQREIRERQLKQQQQRPPQNK